MTQEILPPESTSSAIMTMESFNPVAVVSDTEKLDAFFAKCKAECDKFVPDLSTATSRAAIASMAFKVTKTKTAIDKAGLELTEEWRKNTAKVNAARNASRLKFEELAADVRKPLTDWEVAEQNRMATVRQFMDEMSAGQLIGLDETSDTISAKAEALSVRDIDRSVFQDGYDAAVKARAQLLAIYNTAFDRLLQEEAGRAELAALRAENERKAAEQAERDRIEAEREREALEAEERVFAAEAARRLNEQEIERAAEQARLDAIAEQERAHQAELDAVKRDADAKLAAAQAEIDAAAQRQAEEATRIAEQKRIDDARQADLEHRSSVMRAAKEAFMKDAEIDEETAKRVVKSIVSAMIPSVSIHF